MTLAQWCANSNESAIRIASRPGAIGVWSQAGRTDLHVNLWSLSDHLVEAVSGPVVWLVPRPFNAANFQES